MRGICMDLVLLWFVEMYSCACRGAGSCTRRVDGMRAGPAGMSVCLSSRHPPRTRTKYICVSERLREQQLFQRKFLHSDLTCFFPELPLRN